MNAKQLLNIIAGAVVMLSGTKQALAFYSPQTGRWLNRDPSGENGAMNLYVCMHNRLTDSVDVLGLYRRLQTEWRYGVGETWNNIRVIGPGTGRNGATISLLEIVTPSADVIVSVEDNNCKCVLTAVNLTARIVVFVPLPGDQIFAVNTAPITATGVQSANVQRHESGHVYASQRIFDTLAPMLEGSCTGKYLAGRNWTVGRCHELWVQIIKNHMETITGYNRDWSDAWHVHLGLFNSEDPDYAITTTEYLAYVYMLESALKTQTFEFCDQLPVFRR